MFMVQNDNSYEMNIFYCFLLLLCTKITVADYSSTLSDIQSKQSNTMRKIDDLEGKLIYLQNETSKATAANRVIIERKIQDTKRELSAELKNLNAAFVSELRGVKGRMLNQYNLLREKVVPKLDGIFAKVADVQNAVKVVDGKMDEQKILSTKTYQSLMDMRADLTKAFKSVDLRFDEIETRVISAHKKLDDLSRIVAEIQLGQEMLRLDIRRTELATIYGKDINRLYVLKERYDRLVRDLHEAGTADNNTEIERSVDGYFYELRHFIVEILNPHCSNRRIDDILESLHLLVKGAPGFSFESESLLEIYRQSLHPDSAQSIRWKLEAYTSRLTKLQEFGYSLWQQALWLSNRSAEIPFVIDLFYRRLLEQALTFQRVQNNTDGSYSHLEGCDARSPGMECMRFHGIFKQYDTYCDSADKSIFTSVKFEEMQGLMLRVIPRTDARSSINYLYPECMLPNITNLLIHSQEAKTWRLLKLLNGRNSKPIRVITEWNRVPNPIKQTLCGVQLKIFEETTVDYLGVQIYACDRDNPTDNIQASTHKDPDIYMEGIEDLKYGKWFPLANIAQIDPATGERYFMADTKPLRPKYRGRMRGVRLNVKQNRLVLELETGYF